jgi:hypothetical protein
MGYGRCQRAPGCVGLRVLAEARDDAAAAFVDDVEAAREPDDDHEEDQDADAGQRDRRASAASAARDVVAVAGLAPEQLVEPAIDVAPDLVEIGRSAGTAFTPLGIVQRHGRRKTAESGK